MLQREGIVLFISEEGYMGGGHIHTWGLGLAERIK